VWLPLLPKDNESGAKSRSFMSKRIMLPFHVNIYPLAVLFEAGILLGAASDSLSYRSVNAVDEGWPYLQLERTVSLYVSEIIFKPGVALSVKIQLTLTLVQTYPRVQCHGSGSNYHVTIG
jgi:hypothetical protein